MEPRFNLKAELWLWQGKASWHFITVPKDMTAQIKSFDTGARGFKSVRVEVKVGSSKWKTSLFPTKEGTYCLPVKADIRKKEKLSAGDMIKLELCLEV